jgi:hypothetical protein
VVGKSPDNCRQIAVRARRQVQARKPRFEASRRKREELSRRFFEAVDADDTQVLVGLLAADVVVYGDGGARRPPSSAPSMGASGSSGWSASSGPGPVGSGCAASAMSRSTGSRERCTWTPTGIRWRWCPSTLPMVSCRPCARSPTQTSFVISCWRPIPTEGRARQGRPPGQASPKVHNEGGAVHQADDCCRPARQSARSIAYQATTVPAMGSSPGSRGRPWRRR